MNATEILLFTIKVIIYLIIVYIVVNPIYTLKFKGGKILFTIRNPLKKILYSFFFLIFEIFFIFFNDFSYIDWLSIFIIVVILFPSIICEGGIFSHYHFYSYNKIISVSFMENNFTIKYKTGKYSRDNHKIYCHQDNVEKLKKIFHEKKINIL